MNSNSNSNNSIKESYGKGKSALAHHDDIHEIKKNYHLEKKSCCCGSWLLPVLTVQMILVVCSRSVFQGTGKVDSLSS